MKIDSIKGLSMKRIFSILTLLPLALMITPKAHAESHWLVITMGNGYDDGSMAVIPMADRDQCEMQGAVWVTSKRNGATESNPVIGFECLEGK